MADINQFPDESVQIVKHLLSWVGVDDALALEMVPLLELRCFRTRIMLLTNSVRRDKGNFALGFAAKGYI